VVVRLRNLQLLEKNPAHVEIVLLAGMHDSFLYRMRLLFKNTAEKKPLLTAEALINCGRAPMIVTTLTKRESERVIEEDSSAQSDHK
jgi:hypothetical protein